MSDSHDAARTWSSTWLRAWQAQDVDAVVKLYSPDVVYSSEPFREVYRGREGVREYVTGVFADESEIRAWYGEPIVDGDRAAISWWAALREAGEEVTLAGTSVLRFDADGLVADQWDAWNVAVGRRDPPAGWGR